MQKFYSVGLCLEAANISISLVLQSNGGKYFKELYNRSFEGQPSKIGRTCWADAGKSY